MPTKCELLEIGIMHGKRLVTNQKAVRARRALRWEIFKVKWLCTLRKAQKKRNEAGRRHDGEDRPWHVLASWRWQSNNFAECIICYCKRILANERPVAVDIKTWSVFSSKINVTRNSGILYKSKSQKKAAIY